MLTSRIKRGDIFWFDLGKIDEKTGHVLADIHPVVVVQCAEGNDNSHITIIVPGTSQFKSRIYGWECVLEAGEGGLTERTRICCNQPHTIEQDDLKEINRIGKFPSSKMSELTKALKFSLGMPSYS